MMVCASVALVLCALAPTIALLLAATTLLGLTTVGGQILIPLAGDLADDARRGHVVGTVASGVIIGILLSRTISGLVADTAGWRAIYVVAGLLNVALAVAVYRAIPPIPPKTRMAYPALIASVGALVLRERTVRWTMVLAAIAFGVFMMFWTALTFLLSAPPFDYSVSVIGLFGLVGLAGALAARRAGRLHDRGWSIPATGAGWVLTVVAFLIAALAGESLVLLIIAIVVLDVAAMAINILNQTRLFAVAPGARSRLNTAYVTNNFIGGALGAAAGTILWSAGGWTAVSLAGALLSLCALLLWVIGRRGALVVDVGEPAEQGTPAR